MALTDDQEESLQFIFDCMEAGKDGVLNDWERSFMKDQKARYDQYSSDMRISPKQWVIVEKIEKALVDNRPSSRR